ncbi:hypothetical protein N7478_007401 [Penicillium angulare]|uniref:uncharacterized protein n=1 Tax=Penicillium angulare TaxID=116970 RepID=UPI0025417A98|nr:uncharacterized protein N7478_007401 [Penicillium angulare]KAJ5272276.1 hypothetical protein N7478_007401 [Penicillium angulare]
MPPLSGFSDNRFRNRDDLLLATTSLLRPLEPYFSPGNALVQLPVYSGAHFDETAAQLEGFARPIWAIAAVVADPSKSVTPEITRYVNRLVTGLRNGINPENSEYWGAIGDWDQRMVEAEPISVALLMAPKTFYDPLSPTDRRNLSQWLSGLNGRIMPRNNWRWFRIFANLALTQVCGVPYEDIDQFIKDDFDMLDKFVLRDGWSADGIWRQDSGCGQESYGRQADYYSGSFAIQFSQLLYCIVAKNDNERVSRYQQQAREFASEFWRYFDVDGASIPFGRSLTYRFSMGAFYAAFALAKCYDNSSLCTSVGFLKGMLLRHLRWWACHSSNIFASDGTLTVGYLYPNSFMCEDYNSPQSPYWAMKSFVVLALDSDSEFWAASELPHPFKYYVHVKTTSIASVKFLPAPSQILCNHPRGQHHFMLSSGQFCAWPLKATHAKYSKFAYSSAFGFSVPTGPLLSQLAPDSTLICCQDGENWATRWETVGIARPITLQVADSEVPCLRSLWKPWKSGGIEIETTLIPPCDQWPDWHIRCHRVKCRDHETNDKPTTLTLVEGGFAIQAKQPRKMCTLDQDWKNIPDHGGTLETAAIALVVSPAGVSGLANIHVSEGVTLGKILKSDPNSNLMEPRTLIPKIQFDVTLQPGAEVTIQNAVFAIAKGKEYAAYEELSAKWNQRPSLAEYQFR